ncbi:protein OVEREXPRESSOR OF CATIONIC PEROXIDASE 3-like [Cornus florida]|uniref:protein OVEREXPRESSOR OF CATIONIC PEROXIDASE 3-like n=1 Tax=Cornus florida TaxID=4283 RepID=UPI00289B109F|nr:protein OVEREXPRESSOR OF CATIONIC PEROXIDASE 3-like [Cornus florida]
MASTSSFHSSTMTLRYLSAPHNNRLLVGPHGLNPNLVLPRHSFSRSVLTFSRRRRNNTNSAITSSSSKKKKKNSSHNDIKEDDDSDEDAFEALFNQLEEDLKNDDPSLDDGDDEISEEDLARLERELEEALGDDELLGVLDSTEDKVNDGAEDYNDEEEEGKKTLKLKRQAYTLKKDHHKTSKKTSHNDIKEDDDIDEDAFEALFNQLEDDLKNDDPSLDDGDGEISEEDLARLEREFEDALGDDERLVVLDSTEDDKIKDGAEDYDDEEEEEEKPLKLKRWQLKRLAYALKNGRRKTSIKNLAADLCLDRADVLKLLRDPPPDLLMMSAVLPDKPVSTISEPESKPLETASLETETETETEIETEAEKPDAKVEPIHVMQSRWSAQKRLKKVQVETLERVYKRTKRPTNAMISSIVHVTNLPRKRVVKWFEDKRGEEGVPDRRVPYQRSTTETVFT